MQAKLVAEGTTVTYVVVLDQGEEAFSALTDWAASEGISAAQVTAVGASSGRSSAGSTARRETTGASRSASSARCCH